MVVKSSFSAGKRHLTPWNWSVWLLLIGSWRLVQHSPPFYFGSLFFSNYFQHFLKRANKLQKQARLEREREREPSWGQPLYLCDKLGSPPPGVSPAQLSTLQTVSRYPGSDVIPGQVTAKPPPPTSGLLASVEPSSTSNCTTDRIAQHYIPAGWIILAIKTSSSQLKER